MKREQVRRLALGIDRINKSGINLPFRINYAIQKTRESIRSEVEAMEKTINTLNNELQAKVQSIHKEYADKVCDDKKNEIPLVKDNNFVCTLRESERNIALDAVMKERDTENKKIENWLNEDIEVPLHQFTVSKEDFPKLDNLGGNLESIMVLIKDVVE
jgi:hypothetical protein